MKSTVVRAADTLALLPASGPVALLGFEVSRHLARSTFAAKPEVFDLPICEETMMGAALGFAAAGRHVVLDLMFEGFLARCLEPVLVGLPSLAAFNEHHGVVVVRCLGGPIAFGGPSHANGILKLVEHIPGVVVVDVGAGLSLEEELRGRALSGAIVVAVDRP